MKERARSWTATEVLLVSIGVVALIGTWAQVFGYLEHGFLAGNVLFWLDTVATPASTFITVDILALAAAVFVFMFAEGRRLGIGAGWLWGYLVASMVIGISFAIPVFLAHRQRRIRLQRPDELAEPAGSDWLGIAIGVAMALAAVAYSLSHPA